MFLFMHSTLDVRGIIQQWYRDLAEDAKEFEAQAQRVAVWDQQLRENQKVIAQVGDEACFLIFSQIYCHICA